MSDPGDEMFDEDDYPPNAEFEHAVGHASLLVQRATPESPEVCFDYELVATLLAGLATRQKSLDQIARMRLMPDDKINRATLHAAIEVAKLHAGHQQNPRTETK